MKEEAMQWEDEKEEKKEALDSWIGSTEEELRFAEAIHEILENSTTNEEFLRLAKAKLREYKNPWRKPKETEKKTGGKWKKVLYK